MVCVERRRRSSRVGNCDANANDTLLVESDECPDQQDDRDGAITI